MPALDTQLNARSADFQANAAAMRAVVDDLKAQIEKATLGGGDAARAKHTAMLHHRRIIPAGLKGRFGLGGLAPCRIRRGGL